jgi:hypothetical protein
MGKMARGKVTEARKTGRGTKALLLGSIGLFVLGFRASSWITQGLGPVWTTAPCFSERKKYISTNSAIAERWNCDSM